MGAEGGSLTPKLRNAQTPTTCWRSLLMILDSISGKNVRAAKERHGYARNPRIREPGCANLTAPSMSTRGTQGALMAALTELTNYRDLNAPSFSTLLVKK